MVSGCFLALLFGLIGDVLGGVLPCFGAGAGLSEHLGACSVIPNGIGGKGINSVSAVSMLGECERVLCFNDLLWVCFFIGGRVALCCVVFCGLGAHNFIGCGNSFFLFCALVISVYYFL